MHHTICVNKSKQYINICAFSLKSSNNVGENVQICLTFLYRNWAEDLLKTFIAVCARISPRSRRRAAGRARRASDPPPPGWRWSSWWWSSAPSPSARSGTPAGSRRWSRRSAAPRTRARAGCAPAPLQPPERPATRSVGLPSPPRLLGSVPSWVERFHECRGGLWSSRSVILVSLRCHGQFRSAEFRFAAVRTWRTKSNRNTHTHTQKPSRFKTVNRRESKIKHRSTLTLSKHCIALKNTMANTPPWKVRCGAETIKPPGLSDV